MSDLDSFRLIQAAYSNPDSERCTCQALRLVRSISYESEKPIFLGPVEHTANMRTPLTPMNIVMTLLVRDEADIIASNIDFHHAMGVDFFIVTDNLSTDATATILQQYVDNGLVHYIHETSDDYSQHSWVTRMARMAATIYDADWVINNDADEFWWPERGNLKDCLSPIPPDIDAVSVTRSNFLPVGHDLKQEFSTAMTIREAQSVNLFGHPLPGKVCHRGYADIEVAQGNHSVRRDNSTLSLQSAPILVFHFPMRTYHQFENKIAKGGAAYERNQGLDKRLGGTWRKLYEYLKEGRLREYYESCIPNKAEIQQGIDEGRFVKDTRLAEFLRSARSSDSMGSTENTAR